MRRATICLSLLFLACAAAALLALGAGPLTAQDRPGATAPGHLTTRYLVTVIRAVEKGDQTGSLRLPDAGEGAKVAIGPLSGPAAAAGCLGAVAFPDRILEALRARGTGEVLFRGETEATWRNKVSLVSGKRFPVVSNDIRGDQVIRTTKFEKIGTKIELTRKDEDIHDLVLEVSAVSGRSRDGQPIIFEVSTRGSVALPDGATAVFSFFDRTEREDLDVATVPVKDPSYVATNDLMTRFVVLLTRLDLERKE